MLLPVTGFRDVRLRRETEQLRVFDAVRSVDAREVTVKLCELGPEVESRIEHEFALLRAAEIPGVAGALDLRRAGDELVLLFEGLPGRSLASFAAGRPLELGPFLTLALALAERVAAIHAAGLIHRDLRPHNIHVVGPDESGQLDVVVAELGVEVLLERERRRFHDPEILVHSLPYCSPEQSGRTGRGVDARSDLYSLGAVFYELLTGRRAFASRDPLELVHAQLARMPSAPQTIRPELPEPLARIVMTLLAKAPEHRYQTAAGLLADLRRLVELGAPATWPADFELGREDFSRVLRLPHQIYGRGSERQILVESFEEVIDLGRPLLALLRGPAGIGKSALIAELEAEVARVGSYVARGQFERRGDRPYAAFSSAFAGLIDQLLTEPELRLRRWRERLEQVLGGLAGAMIEIAPELELILGPQEEVVALEPWEARNRLQLAVARFLSVFGEARRPLVLALEDLHWADASSLALLQSLVAGQGSGSLLVLASVREDEGGVMAGGEALAEFHASIPRGRRRACRLGPLATADLEQMLADALARPRAELGSLTRVVARKTGNNPMLVRRLLQHLADRGLLRAGRSGFEWDDAQIEAEGIPANLAAVLRAKLATLPAVADTMLGRAACIGEHFELGTLGVICDADDGEITAQLYSLVSAGFLDHVGGGYRFSHPDIREAALARVEPKQRAELHWSVGLHWLSQLAGAGDVAGGDRLFEVVEQLGAGLGAAIDLPEATRIEIAELGLLAGRRALDRAAFEPALRYLDQSLSLVRGLEDAVTAEGEGATHYALLVDLHLARARALSASNQLERAERDFALLSSWSLRPHDDARVVASRVALLNLAGRNAEAVRFGLESLARYGCEVELEVGADAARAELDAVWQRVAELSPAKLEAAPLCVDAHAAAVMALLTPIKNAAYVLDTNLYVRLIATHVRWVLEHGLYPAASLGLVQMAICVGSMHGRVPGAVQLCERARTVAARLDGVPTQVRVAAATLLFVDHLGRPFAEPVARMDEVYAQTLEVGDMLWAGYTGAVALAMDLEVGTHLVALGRKCDRFVRDVGGRASDEAAVVARTLHAASKLLAEPEALDLDDARAILEAEQVAGRGASAYSVHVTVANGALVDLVFGRAAAALDKCLTILPSVEEVLFASWVIPRVALTVLVAAARQVHSGSALPAEVETQLGRCRELVARWEVNAPANYAHYRALAEGLWACEGDVVAAQRALERARSLAAARGCRWVEGLAAEELAALATREQLPGYARGALQQAWQAYAGWGAEAKLRQLQAAHAEAFALLGERRRRDRSQPSYALTPGFGPRREAGSLDFDAVLRSVAAIGAQLRLDQVIGAVLDAAMGSAGADRGMLVLEREGRLELVAQAELEGGRELLDEPRPLDALRAEAPTALIRYVSRTGHAVVLDDARADPRFADDPYLGGHAELSLLCVPLGQGGRGGGVLLLENRLSRSSFSPERIEALELIAGQATSTLQHARVHAALREGEARWRSLVDGVPDLIALLDERGEVEFVNRRGDDEARLFERLVRSRWSEDWRRAVAAVLERGESRELEVELEGEGQVRWYVVRLAAIEAEAPEAGLGLPLGRGRRGRRALAIATDVSARRQAEADKRDLEAQVRQQQRLESVGTLASGVAHEINNPIQGIMNYADLIRVRAEDIELVREFADEIAHESERVAEIVRNLLAFARHESQQSPEIVDMREIVNSTLSLIHSLIRKDQIELLVELPGDLPLARGRPQQIRQIVMNLVTNARDALNTVYPGYDARKRIVIRGEARCEDGADGDPRWVRLVVEDSGPGIPAEVADHIFDPFFTTKGRDQGSGLGLAVSHGIAREHGGELGVESEPGKGARFFLDLPAGAIL